MAVTKKKSHNHPFINTRQYNNERRLRSRLSMIDKGGNWTKVAFRNTSANN